MDLQAREINFLSLTESIDTSTPAGTLSPHLSSGRNGTRYHPAENASGSASSSCPWTNWRQTKAIQSMDPKKVQRAKELYAKKEMTVPEIMKLTGFKSKDTFYKYVVNRAEA